MVTRSTALLAEREADGAEATVVIVELPTGTVALRIEALDANTIELADAAVGVVRALRKLRVAQMPTATATNANVPSPNQIPWLFRAATALRPPAATVATLPPAM